MAHVTDYELSWLTWHHAQTADMISPCPFFGKPAAGSTGSFSAPHKPGVVLMLRRSEDNIVGHVSSESKPSSRSQDQANYHVREHRCLLLLTVQLGARRRESASAGIIQKSTIYWHVSGSAQAHSYIEVSNKATCFRYPTWQDSIIARPI